MSAPMKPWEGAGVNSRASTPIRSSLTPRPSVPYGNRPNALNPGSTGSGSCCDGQNTTRNPPPVPSRPQRSGVASTGGYSGMYGGYGGYGGGYGSGFGTGMYGSSYGGMYGGYGGMYGGGYGGYGSYNRLGGAYATQTSPFIRRAEESSQAAFQSVESIVQAFGSISMMLESTHFAMLNTFRAVLGAADHFSRVKTHILGAIGAMAIIKTIKNLCKKLLYMLGLIKNKGVENEVWSEAQSSVVAAAGAEGKAGKTTKSWPIVMFFAVVMGIPWVIWKLMSSLVSEEDSNRDWMTGAGDHVLARVEFDFVGETEDELSVTAGTVIKMAPKDKQPHMRGWLLATVDGEREGIVPANYIKILGLQRGNKSKANGPVPTSATSTVPSATPSTSNTTTNRCNSNTDLVSHFIEASNVSTTTNTNTNALEQSFNDMNFEMPDDSEMDLINGDGQT